jgi:hypothetical protein
MIPLRALILLVVLAATPAYGASGITPIALQYSLTDRPPNGEIWKSLRIPTIDHQGRIAFRAQVDDIPVDGGIFSAYRTSGDRFIAQGGQQAPGLAAGIPFDTLTNLQISRHGRAAFMGQVTLPDRKAAGIWAENSDGSLRLVALDGRHPPGVPQGVTLAPFDDAVSDHWQGSSKRPFTVNGPGEVAFFNRLDWPNAPLTSYGIWSEGGGQGLRAVAFTGMDFSQFRPGAKFWKFDVRDNAVPMNDRGQATFVAWLEAPDLLDAESQFLFLDDPQRGLTVVGQSGSAAPGLPVGAKFTGFQAPTINNAGQMAFVGAFGEASVPFGQARGIWAGVPGDFRLVTAAGHPAPGVDGTFVQFIYSESTYPVVNGRGHVAFAGRISGPGVDASNDTGIWAQDAQGQLRLVVREGQLPVAVNEPQDFLERQQTILFNNRSQVAFTAENAIWATDLAGDIHKIVGYGDLLPFHHGFSEEPQLAPVWITGISASTGNEEGLGTSFNDRGELVFFAYSGGNNHGIFLSRAVAVPEPRPFLLAISAIPIATNARRRRVGSACFARQR